MEAFSGLHNEGKRLIVIFDEASGIHDTIWGNVEGTPNRRKHRNPLADIWESDAALRAVPGMLWQE
jgi:hypothetical protein